MLNCIRRRFFFSILAVVFLANISFAQISERRMVNAAQLQFGMQKKNTSIKPKVRPLHKKITSTIFGSSSNGFLKHHTSISLNQAKISFDIDLGEPIISQSKQTLKGAQPKQFKEVSWSQLIIDQLPSGVIYTSLGKPGEPEIPALSITISVPEGATGITPFITGANSIKFNGISLLPKPDSKGERGYSLKEYFPQISSLPILSPAARIRTMRIVSLTIPLAEFSAENSTVNVKKKFTCGVSFALPSQFATAAIKNNSDPVFEQLYSKVAANSSDVERFRTTFHNRSSKQNILGFNGTPTFDKFITDWIDPSSPYIKLIATRTGLYRITPAEIQSRSGFGDVSNWRSSEVRMFNRGKEVKIWIDSTSDGKINAIEYYGERLAGWSGEYYNWDTDSNAYWLTNSPKFQTAPLRYRDKVITGNPVVTFSEGNIILHHERDNFYYGGDAVSDASTTLHRFEWVLGERFIWQFLPNQHNNTEVLSVLDTFMISALPADTIGKKASLSIFLRGITTNNGSPVTHSASIFVNGAEISDVNFNDFDELRTDIAVPLSLLKIGVNTFEVVFRQGNGSPDKWYFDHYSVAMKTVLSPSSDTAIARGQWAFTLAPSGEFNISLQAGSEIPHLYNLTDGSRLIGNGSLFKDAASDTTRYVAATLSSFLHPARIIDASGSFAAILDSTKGADYIIITHPLFLNTAQKLAARRQLSGLRTKVITTDEVFNAFSFGSDEAWALKRYLQYAYDFYAGVPPSLVTLFGDGTWDPKFILNNQLQDNGAKTIHQSFVPTFGVPNTDYIFSCVEGSGFVDSASFEMVITRIPVESVIEGESYLQKIVEYETAPPEVWNRHFLFISGGDAGGQAGVLADYCKLFVGLPPFFTNQYGGLGNPSISIDTTFIARRDFINQIDITQQSAIQNSFSQGLGLVYFFGHGAPNITDVQFPDVGTLRNIGKYPVFISVSCRTGAFAEPNFIAMNESFIRVPEAGAILAYGTSGFGDVMYDFNMSARIFNFLRGDSSIARMPSSGAHKINFPLIMTASKFIESILQPPLSGFVSHNALYEYSILGDAAMGFVFRPQPEFNITSSDIILAGKDSTARSVFSVSDSEITVKVTMRNFGYDIERPVHVRITDLQPGNRQIVLLDTITQFSKLAMTGAVFSLDSFAIGTNTLEVFVDFDDKFAETNETDNKASVSFLVNGVAATPFYPPEGSKYFCDIRTDSVNIILLLPNNKTGAETIIELQFDTTSTFASSLSVDFPGLKGSGLFFERAFARNILPNPASHVIWWRSRITLQSGGQSPWEVHSFSLDAPKPNGAHSEFSYSTADQLATTIVSGLQIDRSDGALFIPFKDTVEYDVEARGLLDTNVQGSGRPVGLVLFNGHTVRQTNYNGKGQFFAVTLYVLTADSSSIEQDFEFLKTDDAAEGKKLATEFASTVASIPDGRRVILLTNFAPVIPSFTFSDEVKQALQSLGSLDGMTGLETFGSYALIGRKGMPKGFAKEKLGHEHSAGVSLLDTVITLGTSGVAQTPLTAVATGYGNLRWKASNIDSGSTINFTVLGVRKSGGAIDTVLKVDASKATSADLSLNPASFYEKLFVRMNFQRSSSSSISPRLSLIELEYDPAPEFSTSDSMITATPRIALEGNPVTVTYRIENVTCVDAPNVPVELVQIHNGSRVIIATDTITNFLGHTSVSFTHILPTTAFQGDVNLAATVNPEGKLNEQLSFNNTANAVYTVVRDSTKPKLDLLFDGRHIASGDYVSSKVKIEIRLSDNSPLRVSDSSVIKGVLQQLFGSKGPITFSGTIKNDSFITQLNLYPTGSVQATLDITPRDPLQPGRYLFTAMSNDASGNRSDTVSDEFVVSNTNGLDHVMNYPNPFKDKTWFTFILKAGSLADVKAVIYTVAGRKIRTLHLDAAKQTAGFNSIEWDGRDEMGNEVANGTYLYRVVLNGTNDDGSVSSDATTERAVRSR